MKIYYHSDHLGSASFVTDRGGNVMQHLQYFPYGELFVSQRNSEEFDSRYKFTAKELDNETSYTYFGARYYDSELSGWLSVDPMSDKYPSLSPYCYSADNPVVLVDPNGMWVDGYTVDKEGNISDKPINNEGGNDYDVLYVKDKYSEEKRKDYDETGKKTGIKVDKGVLNSKKTFAITDEKNGEKFSLDMYQVKGDDKSRSLFEFLVKNTDVEWSITGIGNEETNMLTTIHDKDSEGGGAFLFNYNYTIRYNTHSHPYNPKPSDRDIKFAKSLNSKFPNAELYLYHKDFYIQYNENGIISNPSILLPKIEIIDTKN